LQLNTTLNRAERHGRVIEMLQTVGLREDAAHRYPHMFSGGQRQRIAIARAMIMQPPLVVADEPTSALDVSIQAQILNLFNRLQAERGTSYVFISHNLGVVRYVAHRVAVMYLGRVVEAADKQALFENPVHPYTRALLAASPRMNGAAKQHEASLISGEPPSPLAPPKGCAFAQRCRFAQERCLSQVPDSRQIGTSLVACHRADEFAGLS
jgi:dipeptide transport system ATP-binding protein